jgi:CDP-diglyceride synthetase
VRRPPTPPTSPRRRLLHALGGAVLGVLIGVLCSFGLAEGDETKLVLVTLGAALLLAAVGRRYGEWLWGAFLGLPWPWP